MSERSTKDPFKRGSAPDVFNRIVGQTINRRKAPTVLGVRTAEDLIAVENFLAQPEYQTFLEILRDERKTLGIVYKVEERGVDTYVSYLCQHGLAISFVYDPNDKERFGEAPDGFKVGDIILNEPLDEVYSHGVQCKSVKPVRFPPKTEKKIIRRFKSVWVEK